MKDKVNERMPLPKLGILGFQHVLVMYSGAIIVPILLGAALGLSNQELSFLIAADLFTCGLATLIQVLGIGKNIGIKLPIMFGAAVITLPAMIMIGQKGGLPAVYGAIIVSGLYVFFLSFFIHKLLIFFPKIVIGCLVTIIGFSLTPIAIKDIAGGENSPTFGDPINFLLAISVILTIIILNKFSKGFLKSISILIGIIVGSVLTYFCGMVDFKPVVDASWFSLVTPLYFGLPTFSLTDAIIMSIFITIAVIESVGIYSLVGEMVNKKVTSEQIANGIRAEGIAQVLGGIFNGLPYITFSENVGIMTITGVKTRYALVSASIILILLGTVPKFSSLATIIPSPVLGGAMLVIFGMIGATGIKILSDVKLTNNNLLIISCSIGFGLGADLIDGLFKKMPALVAMLFGNGIFVGTFIAIVMNIFFNFNKDLNNTEEFQNEQDIDMQNNHLNDVVVK
ncbi:xanthine permease [Bacillus sp. 7586-K]|nr:xanthine permease [Bacillus sp. 7586-K]